MPINKLTIKSKIRDYAISFENNHSFIQKLADIKNSIFIVDDKVWELHSGDGLGLLKDKDPILFEVNEENKSLESIQKLYEKLTKLTAKKNLTIISIGGGIVQDVTGFLASTLYRGINWIFVPTTLLAQADSCIGAKTSLNFKNYKNLIGTFYPPSKIYLWTDFLKTQHQFDFFSGLGEVGKLHIMGGETHMKELINSLPKAMNYDIPTLNQLVEKSLLVKKSYIEEDEFDSGKRNMLNFGHCFGHALESATNFAIPHGSAVTIGMILANMVAKKRGLLSSKKHDFFAENILRQLLPFDLKTINIDLEEVVRSMEQDKKRTTSGLPLVMIKDDNEMTKIDDLTKDEVTKTLKELF